MILSVLLVQKQQKQTQHTKFSVVQTWAQKVWMRDYVLGEKSDVLVYFMTTVFGNENFILFCFRSIYFFMIQIKILFNRKAFWSHSKLKKNSLYLKAKQSHLLNTDIWTLGVGLENIRRMDERHCNFCLMYSGNFSFSPYLNEAEKQTTSILRP